jgi:hypothetical protein
MGPNIAKNLVATESFRHFRPSLQRLSTDADVADDDHDVCAGAGIPFNRYVMKRSTKWNVHADSRRGDS